LGQRLIEVQGTHFDLRFTHLGAQTRSDYRTWLVDGAILERLPHRLKV
jgi:hypothetical protein